METALSESSSDMPVALGPIVAEAETTTAPSPASKAPPPVSDGAVRAVGLRLGEHADKTRIVIDLTGAVVPRVDLDNIEKILVIELPQVTLAGVVDKDFQNPLIQSLSIQPLETGGTRAILLLKKDSVILSQSVLKPGSGTPHHRLVIDLKH
jgi:N-acetylmuramoyl-L-alanine amidase